MIYTQLVNKFDWLGLAYVLVHPSSVWLNGVQQNRETNEEHDKDCVEERFHLARMKFERDG